MAHLITIFESSFSVIFAPFAKTFASFAFKSHEDSRSTLHARSAYFPPVKPPVKLTLQSNFPFIANRIHMQRHFLFAVNLCAIAGNLLARDRLEV